MTLKISLFKLSSISDASVPDLVSAAQKPTDCCYTNITVPNNGEHVIYNNLMVEVQGLSCERDLLDSQQPLPPSPTPPSTVAQSSTTISPHHPHQKNTCDQLVLPALPPGSPDDLAVASEFNVTLSTRAKEWRYWMKMDDMFVYANGEHRHDNFIDDLFDLIVTGFEWLGNYTLVVAAGNNTTDEDLGSPASVMMEDTPPAKNGATSLKPLMLHRSMFVYANRERRRNNLIDTLFNLIVTGFDWLVNLIRTTVDSVIPEWWVKCQGSMTDAPSDRTKDSSLGNTEVQGRELQSRAGSCAANHSSSFLLLQNQLLYSEPVRLLQSFLLNHLLMAVFILFVNWQWLVLSVGTVFSTKQVMATSRRGALLQESRTR